jgi:hypothetical protein
MLYDIIYYNLDGYGWIPTEVRQAGHNILIHFVTYARHLQSWVGLRYLQIGPLQVMPSSEQSSLPGPYVQSIRNEAAKIYGNMESYYT